MRADNQDNPSWGNNCIMFRSEVSRWPTCHRRTCPRNHLMPTLMTIHKFLAEGHVGSNVEHDFVFHPDVVLPPLKSIAIHFINKSVLFKYD